MKVKNLNQSSIKTKAKIKKVFAEMMEEKREIKAITVTELVKRADITRAAFYTHFDNIYEVANEFQEEILEKVFDKNISIQTKEDLCCYLDDIFQFLKNHQNIYSKLITSDDATLFLNRLNKKICTMLQTALKGKTSPLTITFFTDGTTYLIIKYFRGQLDNNLFEIRNFIKEMAIILFFNKKETDNF